MDEKFDLHFFLTCPHKGMGGGIQISNLRFIRRGPQLIELPLGDLIFTFYVATIV
jgi:hypothetical protein